MIRVPTRPACRTSHGAPVVRSVANALPTNSNNPLTGPVQRRSIRCQWLLQPRSFCILADIQRHRAPCLVARRRRAQIAGVWQGQRSLPGERGPPNRSRLITQHVAIPLQSPACVLISLGHCSLGHCRGIRPRLMCPLGCAHLDVPTWMCPLGSTRFDLSPAICPQRFAPKQREFVCYKSSP
jgi:hypothetical protein